VYETIDKGETMSKATYPLRLPVSIKKAAQRLAKEDGVSLNHWIAAAVAQKVGVVEIAADFFKKRAGKATGAGLMKFLRTAPKAGPGPEDEIR
jgi:HicB family